MSSMCPECSIFTVHECFLLLQVLLHFGTQMENEGPELNSAFPVMDKLNQRMAKVKEHQQKK